MAGLHDPLSTLHAAPPPSAPLLVHRCVGTPRMTQGRCGSLLLHRGGLSPPTPCRSFPAHSEWVSSRCCPTHRLHYTYSRLSRISFPSTVSSSSAPSSA